MEPRLGVDVPSTPCITRCLPISGRHYTLPRLDRVVQAVPSIDAKVRDEERAAGATADGAAHVACAARVTV
jgi:hypothetical protein